MSEHHPNATPKIHPATREILPEDPMEMQAFEVPGDPNLMLRLLVEEYARIGWGTSAIMQLARDPNYQAFHGLWQFFGEEDLANRIGQILSRCGIVRVTHQAQEPLPPDRLLVQIDLPVANDT